MGAHLGRCSCGWEVGAQAPQSLSSWPGSQGHSQVVARRTQRVMPEKHARTGQSVEGSEVEGARVQGVRVQPAALVVGTRRV